MGPAEGEMVEEEVVVVVVVVLVVMVGIKTMTGILKKIVTVRYLTSPRPTALYALRACGLIFGLSTSRRRSLNAPTRPIQKRDGVP